jgi:hypothetical protein
MPNRNPRHWAPFLPFNPAEGTVIRPPPGRGSGYWVGAPGVTWATARGEFLMVYRVRLPQGAMAGRGAEVRIAAGRDGIVFDDIWSGGQEQLPTPSIGRSALVQYGDGPWRLYLSYVHPVDGRWQIGVVEAERPEQFDLASVRPVLTATNIAAEGVKAPFVFQLAGQWHMIVSYATRNPAVTQAQLHGTRDVFGTGLVQSASGLATSSDGLAWRWEGPILSPSPGQWDSHTARISTIWHQPPVWMALYDGAAGASENYEERCGLAYSFDLRRFHRVTRAGPLFSSAEAPGAIRHVDVLAVAKGTYFYYEMGLPDGSHDLRVYRIGMDDL